jgi:hypothetical protein
VSQNVFPKKSNPTSSTNRTKACRDDDATGTGIVLDDSGSVVSVSDCGGIFTRLFR